MRWHVVDTRTGKAASVPILTRCKAVNVADAMGAGYEVRPIPAEPSFKAVLARLERQADHARVNVYACALLAAGVWINPPRRGRA